jgi:hypothetical protein
MDYFFVAKERADSVSCYDKEQLNDAENEYQILVRKQTEDSLKKQLEYFGEKIK